MSATSVKPKAVEKVLTNTQVGELQPVATAWVKVTNTALGYHVAEVTRSYTA